MKGFKLYVVLGVTATYQVYDISCCFVYTLHNNITIIDVTLGTQQNGLIRDIIIIMIKGY